MRVIAVNHVDDPDRLAALPEGWEVWTTDQPSIVTYGRIAAAAVAEGWGKETVVVQDDIRFTAWDAPTPLVAYDNGLGHVCVRAFRCEPSVWAELAYIWGLEVFQPCRAWQPLVEQFGTVFDDVTHLEPVGTRGGGCRV